MDRPTAEKLVEALAHLDARTNDVITIVETIADSGERKALRRALGEVMGGSFDVLWAVIQQYRDLDPDKDTEWFRELKTRRAARNGPPESDA